MDFNWPADKNLLKEYIEARRKRPKRGQTNLFGCFGSSSVNKVKPPEPEFKYVSRPSYEEQTLKWKNSLRTNPDWRDQIEPERRRIAVATIFRRWKNADEKKPAPQRADAEKMKEEIIAFEEHFWDESKSVDEYDKKIQWAKDPSRNSVKLPGMTPEMEDAKRRYLMSQTFEQDANFLPHDDAGLLHPDADDVDDVLIELARYCEQVNEKKRLFAEADFSSCYGNPCSLVSRHAKFAKAVHGLASDYFGGRLEVNSNCNPFNPVNPTSNYFKVGDGARKAAIGRGYGESGKEYYLASEDLEGFDQAVMDNRDAQLSREDEEEQLDDVYHFGHS